MKRVGSLVGVDMCWSVFVCATARLVLVDQGRFIIIDSCFEICSHTKPLERKIKVNRCKKIC